MWHGDQLYYVSDAGPAHRLNVWVYDTKTGRRRQVTKHRDYDVKWPSVGPDAIVYQYGPELRLLDLKSEQSKKVDVRIPGDHTKIRPQLFDEAVQVQDGGISATGKRAVVQARGDIWTVPAENGMPRAIARTDDSVERNPAWSPDGKWIAYTSDKTGEYEIYIAQSDGRGETKKLTNRKGSYIEELFWSPDSEKIAFFDSSGTLYILDVESKDVKKVYKRATGGRGVSVSWSHDSNWMTFADRPTMREACSAVFLYNLDEGRTDTGHQHACSTTPGRPSTATASSSTSRACRTSPRSPPVTTSTRGSTTRPTACLPCRYARTSSGPRPRERRGGVGRRGRRRGRRRSGR